ncbi:hypothetical protein JTB14_020534 [Gonioctena quinquepunctata]|nr:hypothetical protein JTB14_020534 [Gonioctena quinquepunctata]
MLDRLRGTKDRPHELYFDNLFTGLNLLQHLKERGYQGTGTVRENRIPKNFPMSDKQTLTKKRRGTYESTIQRETGVMAVKWVDTVASTCHGILPLSQVKRYSSAKKKIMVLRPFLISENNAHMEGTDLMDVNLSRYRIGIRSKRWWWPIFTWFVDVTVINAWQIHRKSGGKLMQLEFRREIAICYLTSYGTISEPGGRPRTTRSSVSLNRVKVFIILMHSC